MNVDKAMALAKELKAELDVEQELGMYLSEIAAIVLSTEVERLRAELAACQKLLDETRTELSISGAFNNVAKKRMAVRSCKSKQTRSRTGRSESGERVSNLSWCYESNACDIIISGMSDEDSTKFGNWLNQRIKDRATPNLNRTGICFIRAGIFTAD